MYFFIFATLTSCQEILPTQIGRLNRVLVEFAGNVALVETEDAELQQSSGSVSAAEVEEQ
jgi:hypothetical protein